MSNKIRIKVFTEGGHVGDAEYDQDVIKIGKLKSSHMHFDAEEVARMHAVLERSRDGYRLIDLGSSTGSYLNGEQIDKNTTLPKTGTLGFGPFRVEFELDDGPLTVPSQGSSKDSFSFLSSGAQARHDQEEADRHHHRDLCASLIEELERLESSAAKESKKMLAMWGSLGLKRRHSLLKILVKEIRSSRVANQLLQRKRVATMLNLGMEGMEAIYRLDPEIALEKAHETLMDMAVSKTALEMLTSMELDTNMQKALAQLPSDEQDKQRKDVENFVSASAKLADRLQTSIVAGASLIPAYLSRAGGREATDEDRFQWKAAFDQIKAQGNKDPESPANAPN
jgi:pSer/pThr/pTyr-binding forkhead associated (FHA) protein